MPTLTAAPATDLADWELLPGYEMISVIGSGGFGTVVEARQSKLDRIVAVKVIELDKITNRAHAARFKTEAVTLGRFHHPNIVHVHDFAIDGERMFIAMELLEGEDLARRLQRLQRLDERVAWSIARQTASALGHAANQGVVHRDVKPSNLFLIPAPTAIGLPRDVPMVKVTDFGLALTKWAVDATDNRLTAKGTVLGTPVYMAPEQYRGAADVDHRVDIYSLGATVYHCLAGRPPFDGATIWDVMAQKMEGAPKSWPDTSAESIALLADMLEPNPSKRIGSYEELVDRIDRLPAIRNVEKSPVEKCLTTTVIIPPPLKATSINRNQRRSLVTIAGIAAIAAINVGLYAHWAPRRTEPHPTTPAIQYTSFGEHQSLFNHESLDGWLPPSAGGRWTLEKDEEHAIVVSGTGFTRRSFTAPENYRVTIGLDIHKATLAEVHFGLRSRTPDATPRFVVRIAQAGGAVLGVKDSDKGAFQPLGSAVAFPPPEWFEGRRPYLEVRFERAGTEWRAAFNGVELGRVPDDGIPKNAELRLLADGPARVDSVILEGLQVKTTDR